MEEKLFDSIKMINCKNKGKVLSMGRVMSCVLILEILITALAGCDDLSGTNRTVAYPIKIIAAAGNQASSSGKNDVKADWSSLDALIGKYPAETHLFDTSVIADDLKAMLGRKLAVLKKNTETSAPLQREGDVLYLSGNKTHRGGRDVAYVLIQQEANALEVGLWENGTLSTFKTPGALIPRPRDIQTLFFNIKNAPR